VILAVIGMAGAVAAAPAFLLLAEPPIRADAAAVMLGPGFADRIRHGQRLLAEGMVDYLMIPGRCVLFAKGGDGRLEVQVAMLRLGDPMCIDLDRSSYRLRTHSELELTRRLSERFGFNSFNLVSSPYHMRRIRIIAGSVFSGAPIRFACVSAEPSGEGSWGWWLRREDWWWVSHEYLKLVWFRVYSAFG
jgi:uncharacterized SAM-binding protein YcdF (DUF218 family)